MVDGTASGEPSWQSQPVSVLVVSGVAIPLATWLFSSVIDNSEVAGALSSGVVLAGAGWIYQRRERRKSQEQRLLEVARGHIDTNPALVAVAAASAILVIESILGAVFGSLAGATATSDASLSHGLGLASLYTALLLVPVIVVISKQVVHRVPERPLFWVAMTVIISRVMRLLVILTLFDSLTAVMPDVAISGVVVELAVGAVIYLLFGWLGYVWARKSQEPFLVRHFFSKMPAQQRREILRRWESGEDWLPQAHIGERTGVAPEVYEAADADRSVPNGEPNPSLNEHAVPVTRAAQLDVTEVALRLGKLQELLEQGVITQEEHDDRRAQILSAL